MHDLQPLVTVSVPSYNHGKHLPFLIHSLQNQTYTNFELLIFDNCSEDETESIVKEFLNDSRIKYTRHTKNLGVYHNWQIALKAGTGKYHMTLSADDGLHPLYLEKMVDALEIHPELTLAYCKYVFIDENNNEIQRLNHLGYKPNSYFGDRNEIADLLVFDSYIAPSAALVRRAHQENFNWNDDYKTAADWYGWIDLYTRGEGFAFINEYYCYYRFHDNQQTQKVNTSIAPLENHIKVLEGVLETPKMAQHICTRTYEITQHLLRRHQAYISFEEAKEYEPRIIAIQNKLDALVEPIAKLSTKEPLVSVIMPTLNREKLIEDAIASLQKQSYSHWELIIINDGGTPNTELANIDKRIRYFQFNKNYGQSVARNTALRFAEGEIICYLDDDDIFLNHHLKTVVDYFSKSHHSFVYTDSQHVIQHIDNDLISYEKPSTPYADITYSPERIRIQNFIPINTWAHRSICLERTGLFDESLSSLEDWELLLRFSKYFEIEHISKITVEVRHRPQNNDNVSSKGRKDFYSIFKKIYNRYDNMGNILIEKERQEILKELLYEKKLLENPAKIVAYLNHPFEINKGDHRELQSFNGLNFLDEYRIESVWQFDDGRYSFHLGVIEACDFILVHNRGALFNEAALTLQAYGKKIIYLLDENQLEVNIKNSAYPTFHALRPRILSMLESADKIVVSTEALSIQLKEYPTSIIDIGVDASLWTKNVTKNENEKICIAFFGDENDLESLNFIKPTLEYINTNLKDVVELKIFGLNVQLNKLLRFENFNPLNIKTPNYQEWINFLRVQNIDIALLPSRADNFSKSQSAVKAYEYGLSNIAVIASDVEPYNTIIENGKDGFLCGNDLKDWTGAIEQLVKNSKNRVQIANTLFSKILNQHTVQHNAKAWRELLNSITITTSTLTQDVFEFLNFSWERYEITSLERYPAWQEKKKFRNSDIKIWANEAEQWSYLPHFTIFVNVNDANLNALSITLDSISTQIFPKWTFVVISELAFVNELFTNHPQLEWIQSDLSFFDVINQIVSENTVEYFACMHSGAILEPQALSSLTQLLQKEKSELIYCDSGHINSSNVLINPWFKPDFNLDYLRCMDYIDGTFFITKALFVQTGGFDFSLIGAELYDLFLKAYIHCKPLHIDELLWHQPDTKLTNDDAKLTNSAKKVAISRELQRAHLKASVIDGEIPYTYRVLYEIEGTPKISIIIPTKNSYDVLKTCIDSILEKTSYRNYEIILIDNGSDKKEVLAYYKELTDTYDLIKIVAYNEDFNYSKACNLGAKEADGAYYLFLNNDTEVLHENYLDVMLSYAYRDDIGVVGARLLFGDGTIQHAGVILGINGPAGHIYGYEHSAVSGYMNRLHVDQNLSAVTGACMMIKKSVFEKVHGFNEKDYKIFYSDIDICLRLEDMGFKTLWTPHATLAHHESKTVKSGSIQEQETRADIFENDQMHFVDIWFHKLLCDSAFNKNLDNNSNASFINIDDLPHWNNFSKHTLKIWAIPRGLDGGGDYRIISPIQALDKASLIQAHIGWNYYNFAFLIMRYQPDVILIQTPLHDYQIQFLEVMKKYFKGKMIFEIDDLLDEIPKNNPAYSRQYTNIKQRLEKSIHLCDRLVVSTQPLKDAYEKYNSDTQVVPNFLSFSVWGHLNSKRNMSKKPRVGWAGSPFHTGDLKIIESVVKAFKDEVEWVFMGMYPENTKEYIHEYHPAVSLDSYPEKLASLNLDLALVPLEINNFNEAKSNLRLLELGILGWPIICSNAYPYRKAPVTIVENTKKAWSNALRQKLNNMEDTHKEGDILRQWVLDNYILENNLDLIVKSYL
jgi:glycosyltransferase involved in cell wall biosynthesis